MIDLFFLYKMEKIIKLENILKATPFDLELGRKAKQFGFADMTLANYGIQMKKRFTNGEKTNN